MNPKGVSPLVVEIIGGVITVALLLFLFSSFASPFLEFMIDSKNMNAYLKFTNAMSSACRTGAGTAKYIEMSSGSIRKNYVITYVNGTVINDLINYNDRSPRPILSSNSKQIMSKCKTTNCMCLFKIEYTDKACSINKFAIQTAFSNDKLETVTSSNLTNIKNGLESDLKIVFSPLQDIGHIKKINVLSCNSLEEMGCFYKDGENKMPLIILGDKGAFFWLQPKFYVFEPLIGKKYIQKEAVTFDSISFDKRSVSDNSNISYLKINLYGSVNLNTTSEANSYIETYDHRNGIAVSYYCGD